MKKCILLIDDNDLDNFINRKIIESSGITGEIMEFCSATDALTYLRKVSNDLFGRFYIFLDINMPVMDGFGFLEEFGKLNELLRNSTKIVVVSSSVNLQEARSIGAHPLVHSFVSKPLTHEKLLPFL